MENKLIHIPENLIINAVERNKKVSEYKSNLTLTTETFKQKL